MPRRGGGARLSWASHCVAEGVICAKKDPRPAKLLGQDPEGNTIVTRNLYVMKLMNSLKSRGYVRETFSWCARIAAAFVPLSRRHAGTPPRPLPASALTGRV